MGMTKARAATSKIRQNVTHDRAGLESSLLIRFECFELLPKGQDLLSLLPFTIPP